MACGPDAAPELTGLGDQIAQVGGELTIELHGTDADGDRLKYGFQAADLTDLDRRAQITQSPSGVGLFRWTPTAGDVGAHAVDFTVSDGARSAMTTIMIDVRSAVGAVTAPVFRRPLGSGTALDLVRQPCVDLEIVVEDQDSVRVAISEVEPVIDGAELTVRDGLAATWHWCPTREQQAESRYALVLAADDGDNPKTVKDFLIVLRGGSGAGCPGAAPVIAHTARDAASILDLAIDATVSDDRGIKDAPLAYVSPAPPATPPDLSQMTQLVTAPISGDRTTGVYRATVANPVAGMATGTRQTLYYLFTASDDDDPTGSCDHTAMSPVYSMTVTSTGAADSPLCAPCTGDAQCGAGDECVRIGTGGASYCLEACGAGCPAGTRCSSAPVRSIDGAMAVQCVPESGTCAMPAGACADDRWEVNDARRDASHNPVLAPDLYDLVSCPGSASSGRANDDWFKIAVGSDQRVDLQLAGGPQSDLDLHLYHADGTLVTASTSLDPDEEINACLRAATYYVKVNGHGAARNQYLLSYETRPESCAIACQDDAHEDDDAFSQARETTYPAFASSGNMICPGDDDWYSVVLFTAERLTIDLAFTQSNDTQDLDVHLYRNSLDLWPCDALQPERCSREHGQGGVSNEHAAFTAPAGCDAGCSYFVVVRGYQRSSNRYGIALEVE